MAPDHSLLSAYSQRCHDGSLHVDDAQKKALPLLDGFLATLRSKRWWRPLRPGRGVYLYGEVGRGKTMLMDLLFGHTPVPKSRVHFHSFMQDIHTRIHTLAPQSESHPLHDVILDLSNNLSLLCLDEMEVRDIGDAMILARIIEGFLKSGVSIVMTSNRHPSELYKDGLHRERFVPTIDLILKNFKLISLNGDIDYRQIRHHHWQRYITPLNDTTSEYWQTIFDSLTEYQPPQPLSLTVWGRTLTFATHSQGVLNATFAQLCETTLAASDYLTISQQIHTLMLDQVPAFATFNQDSMRRFILLIDVLYDQRVSLYIRATESLDQLCADVKWSFEIERTRSRLTEMQTW